MRSQLLHSARLAAALLLLSFCSLLFTAAPLRAADKEETARQCLAVLRVRPDDAAARAALRHLFSEEYPARLPADICSVLPISFQACADRLAAAGPVERAFYTTGLAFPDAMHRQDPAQKQEYNRVLYAYVQEGEGGAWRLVFRMLYNEEDAGAEALAPRALRLLLRVRAACILNLGARQKAFAKPIDVWIRGAGDGGAEEAAGGLYLLGSGKPREPLELLRQLAHECGHLLLPPVGPFTEPEPWGNGFLGEMLILRWLANAPAATDLPFTQDALAAYARQKTEPLARAFTAAGWEAFAGNETSAGGLRLFLGMMLHLEDTRGVTSLVELMRNLSGNSVKDWIAAARAACGE